MYFKYSIRLQGSSSLVSLPRDLALVWDFFFFFFFGCELWSWWPVKMLSCVAQKEQQVKIINCKRKKISYQPCSIICSLVKQISFGLCAGNITEDVLGKKNTCVKWVVYFGETSTNRVCFKMFVCGTFFLSKCTVQIPLIIAINVHYV